MLMSLLEAARRDWLELLAVAFGIISVYLSVRQNIWSWPTAIVNVLLYVFVFRAARLYSDMGLQVVYAILSIYGWYEWLYGGRNRTKLRVSRWSPRVAGPLFLLAALGTWQLGRQFAMRTDAALPYLDAGLAMTSLVAQYLMTRKVLENWIIWIAVDVIYVGMYVYKGLKPTAALYSVFLVLAALGYAQWKRSYEADRLAAPGLEPSA
jgi:nicotinamide mononucleotide transporter